MRGGRTRPAGRGVRAADAAHGEADGGRPRRRRQAAPRQLLRPPRPLPPRGAAAVEPRVQDDAARPGQRRRRAQVLPPRRRPQAGRQLLQHHRHPDRQLAEAVTPRPRPPLRAARDDAEGAADGERGGRRQGDHVVRSDAARRLHRRAARLLGGADAGEPQAAPGAPQDGRAGVHADGDVAAAQEERLGGANQEAARAGRGAAASVPGDEGVADALGHAALQGARAPVPARARGAAHRPAADHVRSRVQGAAPPAAARRSRTSAPSSTARSRSSSRSRRRSRGSATSRRRRAAPTRTARRRRRSTRCSRSSETCPSATTRA